MNNPHEDPAALKALQDAIYRERILRARSMTPEERLADAFDLSNAEMARLLYETKQRLDTDDDTAGWAEVRRSLKEQDDIDEQGRYAAAKPSVD